ncbi:alpha/beta-type small acid-soluble spore protein [Alkalicella caledoniensis]|uniref:Alpha/beta-type small acid-soluble spore protein n=2 Tax=Alkalicella caledoniensis TaxID=2731377 RepID=A0A7G9WDE7_ALKCA|nr:alpha/beta-type small acid-soluble spore protein [Alkalicella caledoniensis]
MERFKYETAEELGLADKVRQVGWENMTTRECGMVGGMMVKKMIEATGKYTLDD